MAVLICVIYVIGLVATLLWLLLIRPYCRRHGRGYTPGANIGVTFWVDWQEAKEIARARGDKGMIGVCRVVLWLQVVAAAILAFALFRL